MKFKRKRNRLFIVSLCLFVCFYGLVYKASDSSGDLCTGNVCTDCHNADTPLCGSGGIYLKQVDENTEVHGLGNGSAVIEGELNIHPNTPSDLLPRLVPGGTLYCSDCHEAHFTSAPNAFKLKDNVNNIPVGVPIEPDSVVCGPSDYSNKTIGWFCRTCHKDDTMRDPFVYPAEEYTNVWTEAHPGHDLPLSPACFTCHSGPSMSVPSCECCHYHGGAF